MRWIRYGNFNSFEFVRRQGILFAEERLNGIKSHVW